MNENHVQLCTGPQWAEYVQTAVLPIVTRDVDLGSAMLEIGPGPGAATDWLRHRVGHLTAIEIDEPAAAALAERYRGTNVEIRTASGADLGWPDGSVDSVGTFTMLHHVPTLALQNKILAEAFRVLRPGGVLVGSDSLPGDELHHFHSGDTYNPVDPASLLSRLQTIGFGRIAIIVDGSLMFTARKPAQEAAA